MTDLAPTELGQLLEDARRQTDGTGITLREAGKRAGFSEGRWRQLVRLGRGPGGTVVAAALAVGAEPAKALAAAGHPNDPEAVQAFTEEARRPKRAGTAVSGLAEEIERIRALPLPAGEKLRAAQGVIALFEDLARERHDETAESGQ
ncbi:hypothetical protein [Actinoplanes lobatus]|nr:hypothetical protein [Actinoplanes lobatus]MBB4749184.1 hypothetical protein [Actinoplanes lobatus]